jgi:tetratricopeptide (TPR) repeat protein
MGLRTGLVSVVIVLAACLSSQRADAQPAEGGSAVSRPADSEPAGSPAQLSRWEDARLSTSRASALFAVGNFAAALVDFSRAYELLAGHPRQYITLYNVAVCNERLFRYELALYYYERYLREGGPAVEDRASVESTLEALRNLLATLRVEANVRGEIWVDDRRLGVVPATLMVPAGRHLIEVRAALHESARRELVMPARSVHELRLELVPLSTYRGLSPAYFFGSTAVAAILFATGAALGASTLEARSHGLARADEMMHLQTRALEAEAASVKQRALYADLAFGGAALFGTASLLLLFLTDWGSHDDSTSHPAALASAARGR